MIKVTDEMKAQVQRVFEELNKLTDMAREANPGTDGHVGVQNWYYECVDEYRGDLTLFGLDTEDGDSFECVDIMRNGDLIEKTVKHSE
jgi:hypothetical protein